MADMMDPEVNFDYNVDQEAAANQEAQAQQQSAQNSSSSGHSSDSGNKSNKNSSSGKSSDNKSSSGDPTLDAINAKIATIQQALNESSGYKRDELAQQLAIATADRDARQKVAQTSADASKYGADQQLKGTEYSSDNSLAGTKYSSDNSLKGTQYASDNSLKGTQYAADSSANASKYASDNSLTGTKYSSDNSLKGTEYASDNSLAGTKYASDNSLAGTQYASNNSLYGTMYGANQQLAGTEYSSDAGERNSQRSLEGTVYSADQSLTGTKYSADSSRAASEYGSNLGLEGSLYGSDTSAANTQYTTDADLYKFNASQPLERAKIAQTFLQNYEAMASHPDSFLQADQFARLGSQTEGMPAMLNDLLGQVNPYSTAGGNIAFTTHDINNLPQTSAQAIFGNNPLGLVDTRAATPDMPVYHQAQLQQIGNGQDPTQLYQTVNPTVAQIGVGTAGASAGQQPIQMPSWLINPQQATMSSGAGAGLGTAPSGASNSDPNTYSGGGSVSYAEGGAPQAYAANGGGYASNSDPGQYYTGGSSSYAENGGGQSTAPGTALYNTISGGGARSANNSQDSSPYSSSANSNIASAYGTSAGSTGTSSNYSMPNAISSLGSQPRALSGNIANDGSQDAQFLAGVQQAIGNGPQQWGNQALEKMTQTERDMFSSGLKASGLVPADVYAAYDRSRIGNDASMAGKAA